jgi:inner membrane transporter RhtA
VTAPRQRPLGGVPAPVLVLFSMIGVQAGHACGKLLFGAVGPGGVVAMRLGFTALVLMALWRPRLPADRTSRRLVVLFGIAIAGMNLVYPAMQSLPLGTAVTLQFLGPLALAIAGSRRVADLMWALLAGAGVYLFYGPGADGLSITGATLALGSGACWAAYIVLSRRAGARARDGSILALAVALAAVISAPVAVPTALDGAEITGGTVVLLAVLLAGLGVAVLSAIAPYSLDLAALRRMPPRVFGIMMSLEPVLGGVAGLVLLGETLGPRQWLAIGCVTAAAFAVLVPPRPRPPRPPRSAGEGRRSRVAVS